MIYKEFSLEPEHALILELEKMREWVHTIPKTYQGRPDKFDISAKELEKRKNGKGNHCWVHRFDHNEDFDHSRIQELAEQVYQEQTGIVNFLTNPVAKTWYPENGYLSWHIDSEGGRLYSTWAEGKSYFRYQDPITKEIVTSWDKPKEWSFRIFTFSEANPLWHGVGAEDVRISVGYRFVETSSVDCP